MDFVNWRSLRSNHSTWRSWEHCEKLCIIVGIERDVVWEAKDMDGI